MRRLFVLVVMAACGDNANMCGDGTKLVDGVCEPSGSLTCGYGTVFDPVSGSCMPDPNICRDGTVLIDGTCQDPNANVAIDLEEAAEPNGYEPNANPAGQFMPKDVGAGFVIHGCIAPVGNTPDVDVYKVTVTEPTLLDVTAAGVGGLVGGFEMQHQTYARFGLATTSQTARREVFLPEAGTYDFVVADTRTFATGQAAGDPMGTTCYYVTLSHEAMPALAQLAVPVGTNATMTGGKLKFYSAKLKNGFNALEMSAASADMTPALDVVVDGEYRPGAAPNSVVTGGVTDSSTTIVVADYVVNTSYLPVDYVVSFSAASTAQPLAGTTTSIVNGPVGDPLNYSNQFYFDATAGEILGLDITASVPVRGLIWDQDEHEVGDFSNGSTTWTTYHGLWRAQRAGRYYLALTAPSTAVNTMYSLTGAITPITPAPLAADTPLAGEVTNAFAANVYSVDLATTSWVSFAVNSATTGNVAVQIYDPATAFGRMDPVAGQPPITPSFLVTTPANGTPVNYVIGAIANSPALVVVRPASTPSTFDLAMTTRTRTDLGAHAAPYTQTTTATAAGLYSIETAAGNRITVTVHPTDGGNPRIRWLNPDESTKHSFDSAGAGGDEVATWGITAGGVGAFAVDNTNAYTITVAVAAPYYTPHTAPLTSFQDACLDGLYTDINASHFSDPIDAANPFVFFGVAYTQFRISEYGYLTFDLTTPAASPVTAALPDGAGIKQIVAQANTISSLEVCVADRGAQTAVQWRGLGSDGLGVEMQAIIDGAAGTIEYQYTSNHRSAPSPTFAGAQAPSGLEGVAITPATSTSIKLAH